MTGPEQGAATPAEPAPARAEGVAMDFVGWCDHVLTTLIAMGDEDARVRSAGAHTNAIAVKLFGEEILQHLSGSPHHLSLLDALVELERVGLVGGAHRQQWSPTELGEAHAQDPVPLWERICDRTLKPDQERLLRLVNEQSVQTADGQTSLAWTEPEAVAHALKWTDRGDLAHAVAKELRSSGFVQQGPALGQTLKLHSTYTGLVWETRRGFTRQSQEIDRLVEEWENTSTDFKQAVHTKTADQKASLVKDLIALANTQTRRPRLIVIGFDNKTRGIDKLSGVTGRIRR